jgi:hypothetical protein
MRKFNSTRLIRRCRNVRGKLASNVSLEDSPEKCDVTFAPGISTKIREGALDHNNLFCRMCGVIPGDIDDVTGRKVKFHIGHIKNKNVRGKDELSNLRVLCTTCCQGAKEIKRKQPSTIWLLSQVRRAGQDEQRAVLAELLEKFGKGNKCINPSLL